MENGQPTNKGKEYEKKAGFSEDSTKYPQKASMPLGASESLSKTTTATMSKGLRKTSKNVELPVLKSKIGLVAGALADFQGAGGIVTHRAVKYQASGRTFTAIKLFLIVENNSLVVVKGGDGLEFDLVAGGFIEE